MSHFRSPSQDAFETTNQPQCNCVVDLIVDDRCSYSMFPSTSDLCCLGMSENGVNPPKMAILIGKMINACHIVEK